MVDDLLGGLFGGQDQDKDKKEDGERRRRRARDFVDRYDQGPPSEGYSDDEVVQNYRTVTSKLSPEEYEEAATEAFSRMSPEERREFRRMMRQRSRGRHDPAGDNPRDLARSTAQVQQEEPGGGLAGFFGFGGDKDDGAAGDEKKENGGLLASPITKAVLAGIAAVALKKMIDRD